MVSFEVSESIKNGRTRLYFPAKKNKTAKLVGSSRPLCFACANDLTPYLGISLSSRRLFVTENTPDTWLAAM